MSVAERVGRAVTEHARLVLAVLVVTTVVLGAGIGSIEDAASVGGITEDSETVAAYETAQRDFDVHGADTTTTVIAVETEGNALSRASLLRTLRYQQRVRANGTLHDTLADEQPTVGVGTVVATAAMGDDVEARSEGLADALEELVVLELAAQRWAVAAERDRVDEETYRERTAEIERSRADVLAAATDDLDEDQAARFRSAAEEVRRLTRDRSALDRRYRQGDLDEATYRERTADLDDRTAAAFQNGTRGVFEERIETLRAPDRQPPIDEQIAALESMDDREFEALLERVVDPERSPDASRAIAQQLPRSYEPGSTTADGRLIVVTQATDGVVQAPAAISERVATGQEAARALAHDQPGPETYRVVSRGLVGVQQEQAIGDSLAILGPLALAFVLGSLWLAYRDPVDILVGVVGVGLVLVWTIGAMGWLGIPFGQTMIAAPILLLGLGVDYAFHVTFRYREARRETDGVQPAMVRSLVGVGPALVLVTGSTAVGFLANLTSPLGGIRDFAVVTAIGIASALVVFGLFVPALKTITASARERRGRGATTSLPGSTGRGRRLLGGGVSVAVRAPAIVLVIALLLAAGGAFGAPHVDVATDQELFMGDEPPSWTESLPDAVEPGEYFLKENRRTVHSRFRSPDRQGYVLFEGAVTAPGALDGVAAAEAVVARSDAAAPDHRGRPAVVTPLSAMRATAETNETFAATLRAADTTGDGVPDSDLRGVYDEFYAAAPARAARTIHRTDDGEYVALRLRTTLDGGTDQATAAEVLTAAASGAEADGPAEATATGRPLVEAEDGTRIATSMVRGLAITLLVVLAMLAIAFRRREGSALLGVVTLVPVALAVCWLLGTMALLEIAISPVSALVGSIAVGLGVDYAIHVSERFAEERTRADRPTALGRTVTGTGSALSSSAVTTAVAFGLLSFSLLPGLRQFGLLLALGIGYAFLAAVYVQPSVLALWDRHAPGGTGFEDSSATPGDD